MTIIGKLIVIIEALSPILVAIIGVGGAYIVKQQVGLRKLKTRVDDLSFGLVFDLMTLNTITHIVGNMFNNTKADRFVILTANNGKEHLRATNAIYEQHNVGGEVKTYLSMGLTERFKDFEFDDAYRQMLKQTEATNKMVFFKTSDMQNCDLKSIYLSEKVVESAVFFIVRECMNKENDRLFYCSVATHNPEGFKENDLTFIKQYVDQIKFNLKAIQ